MRSSLSKYLFVGWVLALPPVAQAVDADAAPTRAETLRDALADDSQRQLVSEVLERNPEIARARQRAAAAAARAPQVRALPDPHASLTLFALPIETRVGPQRLTAEVTQRFPWFGKLALREQATLYAAAEARAGVEALRLQLLTEARRSYHELSFLDQHAAIAAQEREHLLRHEEIARARYSAGLGLLQEVIKIQTDITRAETQLVEIEIRRRSVLASLNALRDRPAVAEVPAAELPRPRSEIPSLEELRQRSRRLRPELVASSAELARHEVLVKLAGKDSRPDLHVGLGYSVVDRRRDEPGRVDPPPDNGDDVLKLSVGANLPIWRRRLDAALEEALREQSAAEENRRQILAEIEREIGDAAARLPLLFRQWRLLEEVLLIQAEEAAKSSEAGYTTGKLNALDLLHADHVLFEVRIAAIRTRADCAVALAELEGALGGPLERNTMEVSDED
ncbi:MAG: TolC family protein [bacterium]|nr:TolC family protein [bacterium]